MAKSNDSRRSFLVGALSKTAGVWVAVTGGGAVSTFLFGCPVVAKYGGPPITPPADPGPMMAKYGAPMPQPRPEQPPVAKYGAPADEPYGGPDLGEAPPVDVAAKPEPAYGLTQPKPQPEPVARPKYGARVPDPEQTDPPVGPPDRPIVAKYGAPVQPADAGRPPLPLMAKYGGPRRPR